MTLLRVHSNWKEVSYLYWQNMYPNLKTTCDINLIFFLWTKLMENLLLAKYLMSVTAPLILPSPWPFCDTIYNFQWTSMNECQAKFKTRNPWNNFSNFSNLKNITCLVLVSYLRISSREQSKTNCCLGLVTGP